MELTRKVAIVYQAVVPPVRNGIIKPMKPGGYSDSGADIAYSLKKQGITVVTPVPNPQTENDLDWVFPDTLTGIQSALNMGAEIIWLNTVLYKGHPIEGFLSRGISVVGQIPENVDIYDDKLITNALLRKNGLPIPKSVTISQKSVSDFQLDFPFPVIAKPIRGRGSQGVFFVRTEQELKEILTQMFASRDYGDTLYVEEFLSGEELTITVMPAGNYLIGEKEILKAHFWSLPAVRRFNHQNGIAPYNGTVAVVNNSEVIKGEGIINDQIQQLYRNCEKAAELVGAKAPIRIDCRADAKGDYFLFDLNMKPNMTGASRKHRSDQNSLSALAARGISWNFDDLILNMLLQNWNVKGK